MAGGSCTVNVTVVAADPAGSVAGEKVEVAPAGKPRTDSVTGAGKVVALTGVKVTPKTAIPLGGAVTETDEMLKLKSSTISVSMLLTPAAKFASPE